MLFNIEIAVYFFDGKDSYKQYHYFYFENNQNNNDDKELLLLSYHNNNHFDILYSVNEKDADFALYESLNTLHINKEIYQNNIKKSGIEFNIKYIEIKNRASPILYDEIYNFLKSIEANKNEIMALQAQNPNWHYNQILSKFALRYPKRLEGNENKQ